DGKYRLTDVVDIEGMFRIIESIPSNIHTAHIKVSNITGAYTLVTEQNIITNIITKNPRTPHTLLDEIPECEVIINFIYSLMFFI
ncbi:MAG: hypothetical protein K2G70_02610, partial [Turicibacter sp.]|nr:hypothetical protein [Turicibacter sp.]